MVFLMQIYRKYSRIKNIKFNFKWCFYWWDNDKDEISSSQNVSNTSLSETVQVSKNLNPLLNLILLNKKQI